MPGKTPNDPAGVGIASFLEGLSGGVQSRMKQQSDAQGKEALARYMQNLKDEGVTHKGEVTKDVNAHKPPSGGSAKMGQGDQYFVKHFHDARDAFEKMTQKYLNPNLLNDDTLRTRLEGLSPEDRIRQAELDYAKSDPQGHDLISNDANIKHYQQLIGMKTAQPAPTPKPIVNPGTPKPMGTPQPGPAIPISPTAPPQPLQLSPGSPVTPPEQ